MNPHVTRTGQSDSPQRQDWFAAPKLQVPSSVELFQPVGLGGRGLPPGLEAQITSELYPQIERTLGVADRSYTAAVGKFLESRDPAFGLLRSNIARLGRSSELIRSTVRSLGEVRRDLLGILSGEAAEPAVHVFAELAAIAHDLSALFRTTSDQNGLSFALFDRAALLELAGMHGRLQDIARDLCQSGVQQPIERNRVWRDLESHLDTIGVTLGSYSRQLDLMNDAAFAECCVRSDGVVRLLRQEYRRRWGKDPVASQTGVPDAGSLTEVARHLESTREALTSAREQAQEGRRVSAELLGPVAELCFLAQIAEEATQQSASLVQVLSRENGIQDTDSAVGTLIDACSALGNVRQRFSQLPASSPEGAKQLKESCQTALKRNESRLSILNLNTHNELKQGIAALESALGAGISDAQALAAFLAGRGVSKRFVDSLVHMPDPLIEAVLSPVVSGREAPKTSTQGGTSGGAVWLPSAESGRVSAVSYLDSDGENRTLYLTAAQQRILNFIELMRAKHVDTSLRNPLVNFRHSRGKLSLQFGLEDPRVIYERLVEKRKAVGFLETSAQQNALIGRGATLKGLPDDKLQTVYGADELEERLLALAIEARKRFQEYGSSCLYLAMGMLHYETDESGGEKRSRMAPILLIPVEIGRKSIRERYRITHPGSGPELNLALVTKLRQDFGVDIPPLPSADEFNLGTYLAQVERALGAANSLKLESQEMALGLFMSGRFLMYRDLDFRLWPEGYRPWEPKQTIVRSLLGDRIDHEGPYVLDGCSRIDAFVQRGRHLYVSDCDASQIAAMLTAEDSSLTVVHGPPGTGKSQTIVNLISSCVAQGKSVLFVSKKMAAMEVVRRRLEEAGLGDACLVLHSTSTSKSEVIKQLKQAFSLGEPLAEDHVSAELLAVRDRLNGYCDSISTVIGRSGYTPFQVVEQLLELSATERTGLDFEPMRSLSRQEFEALLPLALELEENVKARGLPQDNVFYGSGCSEFNAAAESRVRGAIEGFQAKAEIFRSALGVLNSYTGAVIPDDGFRDMVQALDHVSTVPAGSYVSIKTSCYLTRPREVKSVQALLEKCLELKRRKGEALTEAAWGIDPTPLLQRMFQYDSRSWIRNMLSPGYYKLRRDINRLHKPQSKPKDKNTRLTSLLAIRDFKKNLDLLRTIPQITEQLFPEGKLKLEDLAKSPAAAQSLAWAVQFYELWGTSPHMGALLELAERIRAEDSPQTRARLMHDIKAVAESAAELSRSRRELEESLMMTERGRAGFAALGLSGQLSKCGAWLSGMSDLGKLAAFNAVSRRAEDAGAAFLAEHIEALSAVPDSLALDLRYSWLKGLLSWAVHDRPVLSTMDRGTKESWRQRFRELDRQSLLVNRVEVNHRIWDQMPRENVGGQTNVLSAAFSLSRNLPEVRQLFAGAGQVVQRIAPVVMMSPEAVAKYLPAGEPRFDVLVGDELSQLLVEEALPAMMRAKSFVAFGDPQQMPPTTFFYAAQNTPGNGGLDIETEARVSVLDVLLSRGVKKPVLSHAYRFKHPSLFELSNQLFYDGALQVFASPERRCGAMGMVFHHLPHTQYERGVSGTNPAEALEVARAVMEHAKTSPQKSLGVVAMSESQMKAIIKELERLREQDPSYEDFFDEERPDGFFVKNLETVQGDERDVMFVSVGYGRDAGGKFTFNFGPVNQEGGERRLNVLFSRARERTEIFSNLTPEDLAGFGGEAEGVKALQAFLAYARDGRLPGSSSRSRQTLGVLERQIKEYLESQGYQVESDIAGSCGPELAVVDPANTARYCLGVCTDGENYQRRASVRDRERLVADVLGALGWKLHNVSILDWYRDPQGEKERLLGVLKSADAAAAPQTAPRAVFVVPRRGARVAALSAAPVPGYERAELSLDEQVPLASELRRLVRETVRAEGPVHEDEVTRRVREACGKNSDSFRELLDGAIKAELMSREIQVNHEHFLSLAGPQTVTVRNRNIFPATLRRVSLISPDEIDAAILHVVRKSYGVRPAEVAEACCVFLFGFKSVPSDGAGVFADRLERLQAAGQVVLEGEFLRLGALH